MAASTAKRTQFERRAQAERRLITAAIELFAEQGFTHTSMAQIGEKAGYSRGLVRERFGSKLGLIAPLVEYMKEGFSDLLVPAVEDREGIEAIVAFADQYLGELDSSYTGLRAFYGLMAESLSLLPEVRPIFQELDRSHRLVVRRWIEQGVSTGEIRPNVDIDSAAFLVVSIIRGAALQTLIDPECLATEALRDETRATLRGALRRTHLPGGG
jgi:AcrR family transcriptional regulator